MALTDYDKRNLSAAQQAAVEKATADWNAANARGDTAGMQAAHDAAERARNSAGYTSDSWGRYSGKVFPGTGSGGGSDNFWKGSAAAMNAGLESASSAAKRGIEQSKSEYRAQQSQLDLAAQYQQQLAEQERQLAEQERILAEQQRRAEEEQRAATAAAVKQAVSELEGRKSDADREYAELFRQLYLDKMNNRKNLDQRLAAQGITGGAAESTLLGYDSAYEDALRQSEQGRLAAQSEFDRAIADARFAGDVETAKAAAESAKSAMENARSEAARYAASIKDLLSRQETYQARKEADEREDAQRAERYAREDAEREERYAREDAAAARAAARTLVQSYLDAGRMPPAELLLNAGMDEATARELLAIRAEEESKRAEREAAAAQKPKLTAAQALEALRNGIRTDAVLEAYRYYYGDSYRG